MASKKTPEGVITKKVKFQNKELTLYSLDGVTWSSRVDELRTIQDRHNTEQAGFSSDLKGEEKDKSKTPMKPKRPIPQRAASGDDDEEIIDDDVDDMDYEEDESASDDEGESDEDREKPAPKKGPKGKAAPALPKKVIPQPPAKKPLKKEIPKAKAKPAPKKPAPAKKTKQKAAPAKKKGKKK